MIYSKTDDNGDNDDVDEFHNKSKKAARASYIT